MGLVGVVCLVGLVRFDRFGLVCLIVCLLGLVWKDWFDMLGGNFGLVALPKP